MKLPHLGCLFWTFAATAAGHAQFVTLEGKKFMSGGQEFYPVAMNYSVLLTRSNSVQGQPSPAQIYYAPDASFGPSRDFDCLGETNCRDRLLTDFQKVRSMGFNTVRITGCLAVRYRDTPEYGNDERRFNLEIYRNPIQSDGNHDAGHVTVDMEQGMDGPYSQRLFDLINGVLDVAQEADLKVILLVAGPGGRKPVENRRYMYETFDQQAVDDYANYLAHLATAMQGHPALLAYDLFNEPQFNSLEYQQCSLPDPNAQLGEVRICGDKWHKEDICSFTDQWYTAIKQHDPDHLVTLGGLGLYELEVWDMGALHLDFYSLHIYPYPDYRGNWSDPQSRARLQAEFYWFSQTCPMPWIIGEIGYSANDDEHPPHTGMGPQYHQYPYMDGTEADQADFVQWSLDITRQYGGSGWSWWYFQEFRWWDFYYPLNTTDNVGPAYKHYDLMRGIYYALLKPGDANNDYYDKLAVPVVQNYSPAPMPETPAPPPANYYNWDNLPGDVLTTGTVVDDATGIPIPNANVRYWVRAADDPVNPPDNPDNKPYESAHSDVTDGNGSFTIHREPPLQGFATPDIYQLIVVGLGTNSIGRGEWSGNSIPASYAYALHRNPFVYSGSLQGLELTSSTAEGQHRFAAWTDLQVQDITVHPSPVPPESQPIEMVARRTVHLQPGFRAEAGSEAHVHLEETFPDCLDESFQYPALVLGPPAPPEHLLKSTPVAPKLELRFQAAGKPRIFPNPAQTALWVELPTDDPAFLELYDGLGRLVGRWSASGQSIMIDVARLAAGPYRLRIVQRGTETSPTFIKEP
jgi:hypothetical protein